MLRTLVNYGHDVGFGRPSLDWVAHRPRTFLVARHVDWDKSEDLAITGVVGKPKVGYQIPELITAIKEFLGWNNTRDAFLVGGRMLVPSTTEQG